MPFHDLNVAYTTDHAALSNTLLFAKDLGYETVALSIAITGSLPASSAPIPVAALDKIDKLRILTRLTLTISDSTQNHRLPSLAPNYDLIALRPTNEKALQHCCSSLECDLISIDFSQRLPYPLKFKTVASAIQRGVRFEICYSSGIVGGSDARRNLISGATQLLRATRGRGIVVSSEAKSALGLRAPWDVVNLAQVWGLPQQRAKEALCEEVGKVVRLAGLKRTSYRGVVDIINGGSLQASAEETKPKQSGESATQQTGAKFDSKVAVVQQKQKTTSLANSMKRKASVSSLHTATAPEQREGKSLSKKELKRRAKKARLDDSTVSDAAMNGISKPFPLQHESIMSNKPK